MKKQVKTIGYLISVSMTAGLLSECTHREEPTTVETRTAEEDSEEGAGISFGMESDSLEEEVEEVWFGTKDWDEEDMGVDL